MESHVGAVVEGSISLHEAFGGAEVADAEGIVGKEGGQCLLALGERGEQGGVAVGGQDYLAGVGGRNDLDAGDGHGEPVDDSKRLVLRLAALDEQGDDEVAAGVVVLNVGQGGSLQQLQAQESASDVGQGGFVGLGVVVMTTVDEALAIAHEPHLSALMAVDGGAGSHALGGDVGEQLHVGLLLLVDEAQEGGDEHGKALGGKVGRHGA